MNALAGTSVPLLMEIIINAIGYNALTKIDYGANSNTAVGSNAGATFTQGGANAILGYSALATGSMLDILEKV